MANSDSSTNKMLAGMVGPKNGTPKVLKEDSIKLDALYTNPGKEPKKGRPDQDTLPSPKFTLTPDDMRAFLMPTSGKKNTPMD